MNDGVYNNIQIVPKYWIHEMCKIKLETPNAYKADRVFPKIWIGYYTFNFLITIMSSEKDMKNVTEIFRNII